jgi:hypothetical protein
MNFLKRFFGNDDPNNKRPRQPLAFEGFELPDPGEHELRRLLQRTLEQLPATGTVVQFEDQTLLTDHPTPDDISMTHDDFDDITTITIRRDAVRLALFGDAEQRTHYTLAVHVSDDDVEGDFLRWGPCLPTDNLLHKPCVDLHVYHGDCLTTASRVVLETTTDGQRSITMAAVVWVHRHWTGDQTAYVSVGARVVVP